MFGIFFFSSLLLCLGFFLLRQKKQRERKSETTDEKDLREKTVMRLGSVKLGCASFASVIHFRWIYMSGKFVHKMEERKKKREREIVGAGSGKLSNGKKENDKKKI